MARGVTIRTVPFEQIAAEVGPRTRLVACSHVSWVGGAVVDVAAIKATGVPLLLDAAQALGAVPVDVHSLGCDFYAASGQKWLCGPDGSGCLWVKPERLDELEPPWPGYGTLSDHLDCLESGLSDGAPRLDHGFPPAVRSVWALASLKVLGEAGWEWVHERASTLAQRLADLLRERGKTVLPAATRRWSPGKPPRRSRCRASARARDGAPEHPDSPRRPSVGRSLDERGGDGAPGRRRLRASRVHRPDARNRAPVAVEGGARALRYSAFLCAGLRGWAAESTHSLERELSPLTLLRTSRKRCLRGTCDPFPALGRQTSAMCAGMSSGEIQCRARVSVPACGRR